MQRTSLSATIDGLADFLTSCQYDSAGNVTQVAQAGQTGGNAVADKRVSFSYADNGQLLTLA